MIFTASTGQLSKSASMVEFINPRYLNTNSREKLITIAAIRYLFLRRFPRETLMAMEAK